jgi:hypothetical protein
MDTNIRIFHQAEDLNPMQQLCSEELVDCLVYFLNIQLLLGISTRCLAQNWQGYPKASPMCVFLIVGRSLTLSRGTNSSRPQKFLFNLSLIRSRHKNMISWWCTDGFMKNHSSSHCCGSVRKSGNDLWNIWMGSCWLEQGAQNGGSA